MTNSPSPRQWTALYEAAAEFKQTACWEWMYDTDIFGVQNPDTGEIGWCCVLGNLGEVFALVVYRGTEGLETHLKMQSGEIGQGDINLLFAQNCLMASFDNREDLEKRDLEVIKKLGLKFRGRQAWPSFRSYLPGYEPWFLTESEAMFLTTALKQTVETGGRFKAGEIKLHPNPSKRRGTYKKQTEFLVRVPSREGKKIVWKDEWMKPPPATKPDVEPVHLDEVRAERVKKMKLGVFGPLEIDFFRVPTAVGDADRPYFPLLCLFVDARSGMVLFQEMARPQEYRAKFADSLLQFVEAAQGMPNEIRVAQPEMLELLEPSAKKLGVRLSLVKRLPMLEQAHEGMLGFLMM